MGKGSLLSGQAKKYKGNQKHKPGCPKGKLASKLVSNTEAKEARDNFHCVEFNIKIDQVLSCK